MKLKHKLLALALAACATGALAAEGGAAGDEFNGNIVGRLAETEKAQCMQAANNWRAASRQRISAGLPSYDCMRHYYGNVGDGAFGRGRALASRDDYNTWQLLLSAYAQSDVAAAVADYAPGWKVDRTTDWLGAGPAARNYKRVRDGWLNMLAANPFETAPTVGTSDHMQRNTVKCGDEYLDSIKAVKNASLRAAALKQYNKTCGPEAMAAQAKAKAEMAAKLAERAPELLEMSDLEPVPSRQQLAVNPLATLLYTNKELKTVVIGVPEATPVRMLLDIGSQASWAALAQLWPAVRDGKLSVVAVPIAATSTGAGDVAVLLASKTPSQLVQTWLRYGDKGRLTITGAEKERIRSLNWAAEIAADRAGKAPEPKLEHVTPDAEALAAAVQVVQRNTEVVLQAGVTALPVVAMLVGQDRVRAETALPSDGTFVLSSKLAIKPGDMAYESAVARQLREIGMLPEGARVMERAPEPAVPAARSVFNFGA